MGKCQECGGVDGHLPPCSEAMDREQAVAYLRRQLAAAHAKLEEAARLATDSVQQADSLAKDLAAANERANRYHRDAQKMSAALTAKMEATTGHSFGRTLANVGYHAERLRRIDTEAALREANERAGRLEATLRTVMRYGEHAEPWRDVAWLSRIARKALEVPDAL